MPAPAKIPLDEPVPERVLIAEACRITGLSMRNVQDLAASGKIPGAAKLGGRWTFDLATLRRWIKGEEAKTWRGEISTGGGRRGGAASRLPARSTDEAFARALGLRP